MTNLINKYCLSDSNIKKNDSNWKRV